MFWGGLGCLVVFVLGVRGCGFIVWVVGLGFVGFLVALVLVVCGLFAGWGLMVVYGCSFIICVCFGWLGSFVCFCVDSCVGCDLVIWFWWVGFRWVLWCVVFGGWFD